ncbi:transposon ty3-I gag-pol polyprotein [Tanacetum coccineum]
MKSSTSSQPNQSYSPVNRINLDMEFEQLMFSQEYNYSQDYSMGHGLAHSSDPINDDKEDDSSVEEVSPVKPKKPSRRNSMKTKRFWDAVITYFDKETGSSRVGIRARLVFSMVVDLEDSKTHTVGGVWSGEYIDHGFTKSMSELDRCYTMLQELRSVIVGGALIHKNREGRKHEGRRIHPTIGGFGARRIAMVPPKVTPQLPKPKVKVEEKIVKAEVVDEHIEKIQDLQNYKQHEDKISTLLFETTNKVDTLKTCKEIMGFNDDEDVKGFNCFRVDVKRKSIEDKVRREVFEVDEALAIENSRARSSFQVRGNHVDETNVNAVWDLASPKILPEVRNTKVVDAFQEEDELECAEPLDREAKQVTYIVQRVLCLPKIKKGLALKVTEICKVSLDMGKHYNELVTCNVVDMDTCHGLLGRPWQRDTKLENKTLATLVASPKDFQAERKETGVSYALVMKGVNDVMENAIPEIIKPLLAEFGKSVTDDTLDALSPLRNIQHQIDLNRKITLLASISNEVLSFDSIKELYTSDEYFGNIWMKLETKQHQGEFLLLDGYLFKGNRLCIPKTSLKSQLGYWSFHEEMCRVSRRKGFDDGSRQEEQHLVVPCYDEEIIKFPTQPATNEISGDNGSNLKDFLIVLTREEADIIRPIMAVEDEPLMMLGSSLNIINEELSNDLDGQHLIDEKYKMMYKQDFILEHCYNILKDHPGWLEVEMTAFFITQLRKKSKTSETTSGSASGGFNLNDVADEAMKETQELRPMGRDRSKAKKKSAGSSRGGSSSFVDLVADKFLNMKQKK